MGLLDGRRRAQEQRFLDALGADELGGFDLMRRVGRFDRLNLYVVLERLEANGQVTARWLDGPYPRRRVYRRATIHAS